MEIVVIHEDITAIEVDAVVSPVTVRGEVLRGASEHILRKGGDALNLSQALMIPLKIGEAIITPAGGLPCRYVIHSATVQAAAGGPSIEDLKKATLAAMKCADDHRLRSVAIPNMGIDGDAGTRSKGARAIVSILKGFDSSALHRVLLVDTSEEMVRIYESALEALQD